MAGRRWRTIQRQLDGSTFNRVGSTGCELRDPDGLVVAWTVDETWAAVVAALLNSSPSVVVGAGVGLALHPDPSDTMGIGTVFTRFDDPPRAVAILGQAVNPHSGKWNHHYFDGWTVETALADFEIQIRRVL